MFDLKKKKFPKCKRSAEYLWVRKITLFIIKSDTNLGHTYMYIGKNIFFRMTSVIGGYLNCKKEIINFLSVKHTINFKRFRWEVI